MGRRRNRGEPSRQQMAFLSLFENDARDARALQDDAPSRGSRLSAGKSPPSRQDRAVPPPGYNVPGHRGYRRGRADLFSLLEMFGQAVDPDVIEQVLDACSGNVERATEALISMAEQARDPHATADDDLVFGAPDGGPGEPPAASSAPAVELTWHALPGDVKLEVFARLTVREACRAAATCRDFAHLAAALRAQVTSLVIPASSVEGLRRGRQGPLRDALVAHPSARTVSFQRCDLRGPATDTDDFEALFRTLAEADAIRQSRAEAYGPYGAHSALGVSPYLTASRSRAQDSIPDPSPAPLWVGDRVCVEALDLKGCSALTDHDVAVMCEEMHAVREVRLSNCPRVGDGAMEALSRYASTTPRDADALASARESSQSVPGVRSVSAAGCAAITDAGARALFSGPISRNSLRVADLSRCPKLSGEALASLSLSRALRSLKANSLPSVRQAAVLLPTGHPLSDLSLAGCNHLESLAISADRLVALNLSGCPRLRHVDVRCRSLQSLVVAQCPLLEALFPVQMDAYALAPGPSALPAPADLRDLLSHFSSLRELNAMGCRALRTAPLTALLAFAPRLASIDLSGCIALASLILGAPGALPDPRRTAAASATAFPSPLAPSLSTPGATPPALVQPSPAPFAASPNDPPPSFYAWERVDVSGCKSLTRVELDAPAPALAEFLARGCVSLEAVSLPGGSLRVVDVTNCTRLAAWVPVRAEVTGAGAESATPGTDRLSGSQSGRERGGWGRGRPSASTPMAAPARAGGGAGGDEGAFGGGTYGGSPVPRMLLGSSPAAGSAAMSSLLARFNNAARMSGRASERELGGSPVTASMVWGQAGRAWGGEGADGGSLSGAEGGEEGGGGLTRTPQSAGGAFRGALSAAMGAGVVGERLGADGAVGGSGGVSAREESWRGVEGWRGGVAVSVAYKGVPEAGRMALVAAMGLG